ncbi:coiled-coil domain-containing protein [Paracoccus aminophilus]|uniref:Bacteriophage tail tape measure N-terminal domain-containing protein n=1 Tax=Paracoccus aminophilus JCM 7686 TaxID=1367847 RepID=S5XRD8_PARAH|nr:hypothetical protein [Paracoccus aminophilus]AGT09969.1 hypothetical protein JCM7686_2916 [Paracoccus aminophilus JCM 7686]
MADEPDLVVSAGFSDSQLVKEANKVVAFYKKRGEEAQKAFVDAQGKVTNTQAVKAHERELDKLSKAYDPVYRAAKRYEDELKRLDRALDVGAIGQKQYAEQVGRAARELNIATGAIENTTRKSGNMSGQLQQVGWQVGDFAVQVGSGTSAAQALGQQLPQLLGAFGAWGAIAGAGAAIAIPLGAALLKVAFDAESLDDRIKRLNDSTDAYARSAEEAATPIDVLRQRYGDLADEVARANGFMSGLSSLRAQKDLLGASRALSAELGVDLNPQRVPKRADGSANRQMAYLEQQRLAGQMDLLKRRTGATAEQAERLMMALNRTDSSNSIDAVAKDAENLLSLVVELSRNKGADQAFLEGWAGQISATMTAAQKQIRAARSEIERVTEQYQTDTEKLKKLSDDRLTAQKMLDEAIKSGNAEAIRMARERINLIDQEADKTRALALANDDLFKAMQQRLKAGAGGFIDGLVQSVTGNTATEWGRDGAAAQKGILELIKRRESGGDYNVTLDHGKYTGGSVNLVNMTLREVLALQKQMLSHPENTKNSSAVGAYQIVGSTLGGKGLDGSGGLIKTLNLSLDTLFTAELQDRLAQQLLREIKPGDVEHLGRVWTSTQGVNRSVINAAWGQQSIPLADPEIQKKLDEEIKERERLAKQAKEYGKTLSENLLTQQQTVEMARQQSDQIAAVKASGMGAQDQARAIAEINGEFEKQKTIMMLVADAKRRNVDLDTLMTGSTLTYKQAIEALGEAKKADIIATNERAVAEGKVAERQQFMASVQDTLKDGLLDAIVAGNSFADVLGNVAKMLAKAALEAALFGSGPFSGGGGSGLLGGLFGSIFGGGDKLTGALRIAGAPAVLPGRANGGPVTAGQMYMTGERGPEPFVPAVNGRILSVPQAQAALRGGQGGGSATFAPQIHIAGDASEKTVTLINAALARENDKFISRYRAAQKLLGERT